MSSEGDLVTDGLVDKPGLIQVLHFRADIKKGWKKPLEIEDLYPDLQKSLKKDFCKKNPDTQVQKKFVCQPCHCPVESVIGLVEHCRGAKHKQNVLDFDLELYEKQGKRLFDLRPQPQPKATVSPQEFSGLPGLIQLISFDPDLNDKKIEDFDLKDVENLPHDFCKKVDR